MCPAVTCSIYQLSAKRLHERTEMSANTVITVLSFIVSVLNLASGAKILAVCPTTSISHQVVLRGLAVALNKRGHELVVVTTNPLNDPNLKNYTEIDISDVYGETFALDWISVRKTKSIDEILSQASSSSRLVAEQILEHPEMRKLYAPDSREKFHLILVEIFFSPAFLALGTRFDAPVIGIASLGLTTHAQYEIGNPILPSHPSHWDLNPNLYESFIPWQRLRNFIRAWMGIYLSNTYFLLDQEAIAKKYFGDDIPSLHDLHRNISLIFVNQQLPISFTRPNLPNIIEINGFHLSKHLKPLPKDLQRILDGATQGFIYMSLGSNVKSEMMSDELRVEFIAAFSKLPYKVIWKYEDDNLPNKPDNVITMKWTPQEAILAHPNIKIFIYQGGLQSTEEAITHAVPLIGLPVMGDQDMQVNKMVSVGVAKKLEITTMNRKDLAEAIHAVATDDGYKQRMLNLRSLLKDRPYHLLENAVWWTEHVIRHRGAPYLRSDLADEPWYQRQDMDIIACISISFAIVLSSTVVILYKLSVRIVRAFATQIFTKKIKVK